MHKRIKDYCALLAGPGVIAAVSVCYSLRFEGTERLRGLKDRGFVLLPKHQRMLDIPLEGMFLQRSVGRNGNYIMKRALPGWLRYFGGVSVTRVRDINGNGQSREEKRAAIREAKERRDEVDEQIYQLLRDDEIVVFHPEGTYNYQRPGTLNGANLRRFLEVQQRLGKPIPFVPLDISYGGLNRLTGVSNVVVAGRTPIEVPNDGLELLLEHLRKEVPLFC